MKIESNKLLPPTDPNSVNNKELQETLKAKRLKKKADKKKIVPGLCPFMIPQRERPCKHHPLTRPDGTKSAYCISHAYIDSPDMKYATCPFEPKNSMPEHLLEQHLLVCPKAGQLNKIETLPYYSQDINFQRKKEEQTTNAEEKIEAKAFGLSTKDDNKLDHDSIKLYIEVIEKTYANLKAKYG